MSKWHGGKGSKQRPTDRERYEENYERLLGYVRNKSEKRYTELIEKLAIRG